MNIKKWQGYFREALSSKNIKEQFRPGSVLSKMFLFAFVGAVALGVIYSFVMNNLVGTRASTEMISATTAVSKPQVALGEEFTVNLLLAAPAGKKVSQLDLRLKFPVSTTTGDVTYTNGGYESAAVGSTETNYFDTLVLEEVTGTGADKKLRLVLSARKTEDKLSDKVLVKVKFKGTQNGKVTFSLDDNNMEIVGPGGGGAEPVSYSIGVGSVKTTEVQIGSANVTGEPSVTTAPTSTTAPGGPSPTNVPTATPQPPTPTQTTDTKPTPTITIAPAPKCSNPLAFAPVAKCNHEDMYLSIIDHTTNAV